MKDYPEPIDLSKLKVRPLAERQSLSTIERLLIDPAQDPRTCQAETTKAVEDCARKITTARERKASVMLLYGAHLIKNGAQRIVNRLLERGWITHLATNGAGTIHDWELAFPWPHRRKRQEKRRHRHVRRLGRNRPLHSPGVAGRCLGRKVMAAALADSLSRMASPCPQLASLKKSLRDQPAHVLAPARADLLQAMLIHKLPAGPVSVKHRWKETSILAQSFRHRVPLTVHPGIGYDIISNHPMFNGAAIGRGGGNGFSPVRPGGGRARWRRGAVGWFGHHGAAGF